MNKVYINNDSHKGIGMYLKIPIPLIFMLFLVVGFTTTTYGQSEKKAYFVDGYHGGVWGHYPDGYTDFLVDELMKNPSWKINLEIEPETFDSVMANNPEGYKKFKEILQDPAYADRIEFVNPSYGQSYLYNISGESIIRQFDYGIQRTKKHFPGVEFVTYSSEEPCFTSALPQILNSFGFRYAVLKNPNTCWGGYCRARGGELVNWIGPDGSSIKTVPRYSSETLEPGSTWQTQAWDNSTEYIQAAFDQGIKNPVGMTLQDAAWTGGPWLGGAVQDFYQPSEYVTWRHYFEHIASQQAEEDWHLNQEDIQVSLVWGSQVLQRIAQQVRATENNLIQTEKLASMAYLYASFPYPDVSIKRGWRNLMLAQHHDCWIVPYNGSPNNTWADKVRRWTNESDNIAKTLNQKSIEQLFSSEAESDLEASYLRVFNTTATERREIIAADLPDGISSESVNVKDASGNTVAFQLSSDPETKEREVLFQAKVPSIGYSSYKLVSGKASPAKMSGANIQKKSNGRYVVETDLYRMTINPEKGGVIESLIGKKLNNKEFVDPGTDKGLNELRGHFYKKGRFYSSTEQPAEITVVDQGPLRVKLKIEGTIADHPFTQTIAVEQGERRINFNLNIDWKGNPGIGKFSQDNAYEDTDRVKAFYNNKYKLHVALPLNLANQRLYKNAPFSVMESELENTFFDRWDNIKNVVLLDWVDVTDQHNGFGAALLSDHTTSYVHGQDHPLGLIIQYIGRGLWGRNYRVEGPTSVNYALIPHQGKWDEAGIWTEGIRWREPLKVQFTDDASTDSESLLKMADKGIQVTSVTTQNGDLYVRLFNAENSDATQDIVFDCLADEVQLVELNGEVTEKLEMNTLDMDQTSVQVSIPQFSVRTLKLTNVKR